MGHDSFVAQQSTIFGDVVRCKLNMRLGRKLRLGLGCTEILEAAGPKGYSEGLLFAHLCSSRSGVAEVIEAEKSCFDRDTVARGLVGQGLIGERNAEQSAWGTGWRRAAVGTEMAEYSRTAGKRVDERVAVAHGGMTLAVHYTQGWLSPAVFSTGL